MLDFIINWIRSNAAAIAIGIGSAALVALIKPVRDAIFKKLKEWRSRRTPAASGDSGCS